MKATRKIANGCFCILIPNRRRLSSLKLNMSDSENCFDGVPPEIAEIADSALNEILPEKSRQIYENIYDVNVKWKK